MQGKTWLYFLGFLITIFIGIVIYDNQESIHWTVLQKEGLAPLNQSAPSIIPHIPFAFTNVIMLIIVLVIIVGIFIGIYSRFS